MAQRIFHRRAALCHQRARGILTAPTGFIADFSLSLQQQMERVRTEVPVSGESLTSTSPAVIGNGARMQVLELWGR